MRVLIDIDGVLADFCLSYTSVARSLGLSEGAWSTSEQKTWYIEVFDNKVVWDSIKNSWNWWMGLNPLIDDTEVVLLNDVIQTHNIYFVTNRPSTKGLSAEAQSRAWLSSLGVMVDHASVIATKSGTKGKLAKALDIDIAIDDRPENITEMSAENIKCVVRAWQYNKGLPHKRVQTLKQFIDRYL